MRAGNQAFRFSHLLVKNWRVFPKAEVQLGPRAFLAGPSAAGKSSLLDALRFLADLTSAGCGFQEAVRRRGGVPRLRCLAARQNSDVGVLIHAGPEHNAAEWEYELRMNEEHPSRPFIKRERLCRRGEDIFSRPDESDRADAERMAHSFLEQGSLHKDVREFTDCLASVRYMHLAPQFTCSGDSSPAVDLWLDRIASAPDKLRNARLRSVLEVMREAVPKLEQIEAFRDGHGQPHLRALYAHWRPRGAWQGEAQLADGTLRLLGMLWTVLEPGGPLLIEEPEVSLHPQLVRMAPRMLTRLARRSRRQLILTTHSPDLVQGQGVAPTEVLLLNPREQGTSVRPALELAEAVRLLCEGALPSEPTPPHEDASQRQIALFTDPLGE